MWLPHRAAARAWFAGFTSQVRAGSDPTSLIALKKTHIDMLKSQWNTFLARIANLTR
ncbi:hypothetical protein BN137_3700 [Cronobacter condimenti 1330]|uniref:Uncharacterized protein n=1 Tax=Cronobacter condimenti 1330 TaxID=1073999 RepID=K8AJ60_9ENTR|nr:hypothetical protein [Cronobacter condimenti]CCJ74302.1 hypothetical protein BN137_3700 [Cronobacter condimenti 1330]